MQPWPWAGISGTVTITSKLCRFILDGRRGNLEVMVTVPEISHGIAITGSVAKTFKGLLSYLSATALTGAVATISSVPSNSP